MFRSSLVLSPITQSAAEINEKLHSKIIISDFVGFFVEFDGGSPRSQFKQEHGQTDIENG